MRMWRLKELEHITQRRTADAQVSGGESRSNPKTHAPDSKLIGKGIWKKSVLTDGNVRRWCFVLFFLKFSSKSKPSRPELPIPPSC